ncbi:hypothetical protein BDD12DRAFT_15029 [Trichophaea hybrida]|nr:hypothetical protein BDD12DRAFT_15029 [Trichophaea hybrida]
MHKIYLGRQPDAVAHVSVPTYNKRFSDINPTDSSGGTAVHTFSRHVGHSEIARARLERGADLIARNGKGRTLLHILWHPDINIGE